MVCLTSMGSSRIGPLVAAGVLATTLVGATGGGVVGAYLGLPGMTAPMLGVPPAGVPKPFP